MGKKWARTEEQQKFLDAKLNSYMMAQLKQTKGAFIAELQNEWFKRWPERDMTIGPGSTNLTAVQEASVAEAIYNRKMVSIRSCMF